MLIILISDIVVLAFLSKKHKLIRIVTLDSQDILLQELLNDDSFIRWLNGQCSRDECKKWNNWSRENFTHQMIVEKAKKIVTIPFTEKACPDKIAELNRLMEQIDTGLQEEND